LPDGIGIMTYKDEKQKAKFLEGELVELLN